MKTQIILLSLMQLFIGLSGASFLDKTNVHPTLLVLKHFPANAISNVQGNIFVDRTNFVVKDEIDRTASLDKELTHSNKSDTIKNTLSYKVIRCTPTLKYTIRKVGEGNRVMFSINNGTRKFPKFNFTQTSGSEYTIQGKHGFDGITFPFNCIINCPIDYTNNGFSNLASLINDFEVEIMEPGYWEITFIYY